jgi:FkbM family methyltransferase
LTFSDTVASVRTTDHFTMKVLPNELIGRHIYLSGEFDRSNVEVLCCFAQDGDTLLDLGANVGYVSACFLANVKNSDVLAVEPQPDIFRLLQENLMQFGPGRQRAVQVALSDTDGVGWFEIDQRNRGASRLVTAESTRTTRVEMWSAARLLRETNVSKVDLIKIDVEGHEEQVFLALKTDIQRLRPRAILFEDHARKGATDGPIGRIMDDLGYRVLGIQKQLMSLTLTPVGDASSCRFNDYIAIAKDGRVPDKALRGLNWA